MFSVGNVGIGIPSILSLYLEMSPTYFQMQMAMEQNYNTTADSQFPPSTYNNNKSKNQFGDYFGKSGDNYFFNIFIGFKLSRS